MENDPLLPESSRSSHENETRICKLGSPFHGVWNPVHIIMPVVFLNRLAMLLPNTTTIEVIRQIICQIYWSNHNPPVHGGITEETCENPSVQEYFAIGLQVYSVLITGTGVVICGLTNHFSCQYGRKPVFLFYMISNLFSITLLVGALLATEKVQAILFFAFLATSLIGQLAQFDLIVNMYLVDVIKEEDRTSTISLATGAGALGGIPAFTLGGMLTQHSQSVLAVYFVALVVHALTITFTCQFLPESFGPDERSKLKKEQDRRAHLSPRRRQHALIAKVKLLILPVLHPLALLQPSVNPETGRRNLRMIWCAIHGFFAALGAGYIPTAIVIFLTTKAGFKPDDNGFVLTTLALSCGFALIVLMPLIIKYIRPLLVQTKEEGSTSKRTGFEIGVILLSWLVDIIVVAVIPHVMTRSVLFFVLAIHGIQSLSIPALRTVAIASVEPVRSGEALSAVDMAVSLGNTLSCLVLGSILSATINTHPSTTFWVYSSFGLMAILPLSFVRDEDSYKPPTLAADEDAPSDDRLGLI